jgi:hypothetical protein
MNDEVTADHIATLDRRVRELQDACIVLGKDDDILKILELLHKPGFTTPVEVFFLDAILDAVSDAVQNVQRLRQSLHDGVVAVSEASGE